MGRRSRSRVSYSSSYSSHSGGSYSSRDNSRSRSPLPPTAHSRSHTRRSRSPPPSHHRSSSSIYASRRRRSLSPVLSTKIVVNKLTKNVKEAHLQEIFGAFGRINRIEVLIDEKCN